MINFAPFTTKKAKHMQTKKTVKAKAKKKPYPWRKVKGKWTNTLFEEKLLKNPSLMTSTELSNALKEHQEWRTSYGKYNWEKDPYKEGKEEQPPFSPDVLTNLIWEAIVRLQIVGEMSEGRFKKNEHGE